ncbi:MAG: zinc-ribbon domain-containing protein [Lachnospiraceae bacterium]|nr:zinc-ribbon domain-containing protein [Lachnospiraceae bacterium]
MFCKKCGAKNDDDAVFCVSCGTKIGESQAEVNNLSKEIVWENDKAVKENDNQNSGDNLSDNLSDSFFQQADNNVEDEKNENVEEVNQEETKNTEDTIEPVEISKTQDNYDNVQNNQIDNQPDNSFARSQFENDNQFSNGVQNVNSNPNVNQFAENTNYGAQEQTEKANKFSFKRFLFSAIVLIATILSCATLFMNYLSIDMEVKVKGEKSQKESIAFFDIDGTIYIYNKVKDGKKSITGIDIIKSGVDEDVWFNEDHKSIDVTKKTIRYCTIGLGVALVVFAVIEFILLVVVRRRGAYVLIMLFSLIKLGLGGYIGYLWCFKLLNIIKDSFNDLLNFLASEEYVMTITAGFGIGFILMMAAQLVTFICSIILMTCKNRKKVKYN